MNNHQHLKASIDSLKEFRKELHDKLDSSDRAKLDQIIEDLECNKSMPPDQILRLIGRALKLLPYIAKIRDLF